MGGGGKRMGGRGRGEVPPSPRIQHFSFRHNPQHSPPNPAPQSHPIGPPPGCNLATPRCTIQTPARHPHFHPKNPEAANPLTTRSLHWQPLIFAPPDFCPKNATFPPFHSSLFPLHSCTPLIFSSKTKGCQSPLPLASFRWHPSLFDPKTRFSRISGHARRMPMPRQVCGASRRELDLRLMKPHTIADVRLCCHWWGKRPMGDGMRGSMIRNEICIPWWRW